MSKLQGKSNDLRVKLIVDVEMRFYSFRANQIARSS